LLGMSDSVADYGFDFGLGFHRGASHSPIGGRTATIPCRPIAFPVASRRMELWNRGEHSAPKEIVG
jgi:hypothetical protein